MIVCLFILWLISYKIEKWHGKFLHTHLPLCPVCYLGTDYIDDLFLCPMSFLGTISVDDLLRLCPVVSRDYLPEKGGGVLKTSWDFKGHSSSCGSNPQCRSNLMYHHCCLQIKHHSLLDSSNKENNVSTSNTMPVLQKAPPPPTDITCTTNIHIYNDLTSWLHSSNGQTANNSDMSRSSC